MRRRLIPLLAGLIGSVGSLAAAQEQPSEVFPMDEVVVTATRNATEVKDIPANVSVITKEDIKQSAALTVDDVLKQIPGFSLLRQTSSSALSPTTQGVSLRGLGGSSSSRTLVLLDGVPLNDAFGGWVYWDRVPLESIERIEVVRGGASTTWGNLALGGVINIITARPDKQAVRARAEGGNHSTVDLSLFGSDVVDGLGLSVTGEYFNTDGWVDVQRNQRGPIDTGVNSAHKTAGGKLEYALSPDALVYLHGSYYAEDRDDGTPLAHDSTDIGYVRAGGNLNTDDGSTWQATSFANLETFKSFTTSVSADRTSETPSLDQFNVPATTVGASLQWSRVFYTAHQATAGTDFLYIDGETNERSRFQSGQFTLQRKAGGHQVLDGIYLQDVFTPAPQWVVIAAGRVDLWRNYDGTRVDHNLQTGAVTADETFPNRTRATFDPSLSLLYHATDDLAVRGAAYQGVRDPNLNELYRPFRSRGFVTEANAKLDPERLNGVEAGFDYTVERSFLARITGFWNEVEDPIFNVTIATAGKTTQTIQPCGSVSANTTCRQRQNSGRFRSAGTEVEGLYRFADYWNASISYMYDNTDVLSAPQAQLVGNQVRGAPENQFVLRGEYNNPALLYASVLGRYIGGRYDDDLNNFHLDAAFTVDVLLERQLVRGCDLFIGVQNLFDKTVQVGKGPDGIVGTGTPVLVHGGLRVTF